MIKNCNKCGVEIPSGRIKILPFTKTCVKCSEITKKAGLTVQLGEGDHTYNEIIIVDNEQLIEHELPEIDHMYYENSEDEIPSLKEVTNIIKDEFYEEPFIEEIETEDNKTEEDAEGEIFN